MVRVKRNLHQKLVVVMGSEQWSSVNVDPVICPDLPTAMNLARTLLSANSPTMQCITFYRGEHDSCVIPHMSVKTQNDDESYSKCLKSKCTARCRVNC